MEGLYPLLLSCVKMLKGLQIIIGDETLPWWQTIVLSVLQGVSELFPVSSLGHGVIFAAIVNRGYLDKNNAANGTFLNFLVALHFGTATALLIYFWRDWLNLVKPFIDSLQRKNLEGEAKASAHFAWLLIIGTIPAGILGLLFEKPIRNFFTDPRPVAIFLVLNGIIMLIGERIRQGKLKPTNNSEGLTYVPEHEQRALVKGRSLSDFSWVRGLIVGTSQAIALLPGFSRSGCTMIASLVQDLEHEDAARYSFMLATPIIFAASIYKLPTLFKQEYRDMLLKSGVGAIIAGVCAFLCVKFLMRYFQTNRLDPFGYYCLVAGIGSFLFFTFS